MTAKNPSKRSTPRRRLRMVAVELDRIGKARPSGNGVISVNARVLLAPRTANNANKFFVLDPHGVLKQRPRSAKQRPRD